MEPTTIERFWAKVDVREPDECWPWLACITARNTPMGGYGQFHVGFDGDHRRVRIMAHRMAYQLMYGDIPPGAEIDHTCHDPQVCQEGRLCPHRRCCNPRHMAAVTHSENMKRGHETHCTHGHEWTEENTYFYAKAGTRRCRTCRRERWSAGQS